MVSSRSTNSGIAAAVVVLLGTILTAVFVQSVLSDAALSGQFVSRSTWAAVSAKLSAAKPDLQNGTAVVAFFPIWLALLGVSAIALLAAVFAKRVQRRTPNFEIVGRFAFRGWLWWLLPGAWEVLRITAGLSGSAFLSGLVFVTPVFWIAVALAGWLAEGLTCLTFVRNEESEQVVLAESGKRKAGRAVWIVGGMFLLYVVPFVWMNWQMYWALNIPHGDSGMYEEHLWNLEYGKGFRSYLDDGRLFLGEHMQVVHVLLVPVHFAWSSMLLMELCESLALAVGAFPVFWMARRHSGSDRIAALLAGCFLLYLPLHFLDIAIDGKTFRPTCFGIPAVLFALDQMERRRFRTMLAFLLLALSAKEDYAVIVACLGVWMACRPGLPGEETAETKRRRFWGIGLTVFGTAYLLLVVKFVIPAFRGGDVHYARYFGELGSSPADIVRSLWERPVLLFTKLFSVRTLLYALFLLLPVGLLPLRSPGRLAVALPWFGVLCLLELTADPEQQGQMLVPFHHFHAAIIPVIFWAATGALRRDQNSGSSFWPAFAFSAALVMSVFQSFHPLSIPFWDDGSSMSRSSRYVITERAKAAEAVVALIPKEARVFSTDYIHTRFTHHHRSYDYSAYPRKTNEELTQPVPGEMYYIVIDTNSRYSNTKRPEDVKEFRDSPEVWELVHHPGEKWFIVLKRRS